ncbi:MAG: GNAT family N-acetyltransferase [Acidimicrobiia bacterium]
MRFRTARPEDHASIAAFTQDTFDWGDYVSDRFTDWLADPATEVFVASDEGAVVALVRVELLSPEEAFLASARVAPSYRGQGLAGTLNDMSMDWAREQGAVVGRLAVEDWNEPARRQVRKLGFRTVSSWNFSHKPADQGRDASAVARLEVTDAAEAESAFGAWATGDLARAAHELFQDNWSWRKMLIDDLTGAAANRSLLAGPNGWVIVSSDPEDDTFWVPWLQTSHSEAPGMATDILAVGGEAALIRVMAPSVPWLDEALARAGFELNPIQIYEKETSRA